MGSNLELLKKALGDGSLTLDGALIELSSNRKDRPCTLYLNSSSLWEVDTFLIGRELDRLGIKITSCFWDCFAHQNKTASLSLTPQAESLVQLILTSQGREVRCSFLWKLLPQYKGLLFEAVKAFNSSGIKIINCQLGLF